jgi:hypothetical protein
MSAIIEAWMTASDGTKLYTAKYPLIRLGGWGALGARAAILFVYGFVKYTGRWFYTPKLSLNLPTEMSMDFHDKYNGQVIAVLSYD